MTKKKLAFIIFFFCYMAHNILIPMDEPNKTDMQKSGETEKVNYASIINIFGKIEEKLNTLSQNIHEKFNFYDTKVNNLGVIKNEIDVLEQSVTLMVKEVEILKKNKKEYAYQRNVLELHNQLNALEDTLKKHQNYINMLEQKKETIPATVDNQFFSRVMPDPATLVIIIVLYIIRKPIEKQLKNIKNIIIRQS